RLLLLDAVDDAGPRRWRDWLVASDLGHIELLTEETAATQWLAASEVSTHG
ncbi:MAG: hypothetical protein JWQ11_2547, partial [Rhizobacter sp.]|nr:hypothetical protein [Rhizobacter sp.]